MRWLYPLPHTERINDGYSNQFTDIDATDLATIVGRTDKDFTDGICSGYLTYYDHYQGKSLADLDVYKFLAQNILDVRGTNAFNAGYCTGWIEALLEDRKVLN